MLQPFTNKMGLPQSGYNCFKYYNMYHFFSETQGVTFVQSMLCQRKLKCLHFVKHSETKLSFLWSALLKYYTCLHLH